MAELSLVPMESTERPASSGVGALGDQKAALPGSPYEGADRTSRELGTWQPVVRSPDADINKDKQVLDNRGIDLTRNVGYMTGAASIHKDSVVGSQFRLNARPNVRVLGLDETWADEFQQEVEAKFGLYAESTDNWIDASRMNTLTGLVRLAIGMHFSTGEALGTLEWMKGSLRPFRTAVQMIDPARLSNPNDVPDTMALRRGVEKDSFGAPLAYHFRAAHPKDPTAFDKLYTWNRVPVRKPWGRLMVVHIIEQMRPGQTRGVAEMVSVLKEMKMTQRFHDITLQNAVVNATFAAVIESELPPEAAMEMIGVGEDQNTRMAQMLSEIAAYQGNSRNITIDGAKIPHLYPNTKLKLLPAGTPGGVGTDFEQSLLRHVAAGLGLSYEQFSRDYTNTNYSSARASMNETWKYMQSKKKLLADRFANIVYACWLEEAINSGEITSLPLNAPSYYDGQNKDAYCQATWIGAPRGQIDEVKETTAAAMRISMGVGTLEDEAARVGKDWREVIDQRAREEAYAKEKGVTLNYNGTMTAGAQAQAADQQNQNNDNQNGDGQQNGDAGNGGKNNA